MPNVSALHNTLRWRPGFRLIRIADTYTLAFPLSLVLLTGLHGVAKKGQSEAGTL